MLGQEKYARKWCLFLCSILFEVICAFAKLCFKISFFKGPSEILPEGFRVKIWVLCLGYYVKIWVFVVIYNLDVGPKLKIFGFVTLGGGKTNDFFSKSRSISLHI